MEENKSYVYVEVQGECRPFQHFPGLKGLNFKPTSCFVLPVGSEGTLVTQSVIIAFSSEDDFEKEQLSNCLQDCIPLFQAMLEKGWFYDEQSTSHLWVQRRVQEDEALQTGFIPFRPTPE